MRRVITLILGLGLALSPGFQAASAPGGGASGERVPGKTVPGATVRVVTTLPVYASIAESVGGERVEASAISRGDEDAHFVKPKPSFALALKAADLFVNTGLDLELWAPVLVDKSGNRKIRQGEPGYVNASQGVPLADVPEVIDRSAGDVHIYGNPHVFTSPLNAKIIAGNIAAGLKRIDPAGAAVYDANLGRFRRRLDEALYGPDLVAMLGAETLDPLARSGRLLAFLESQEYQDAQLVERLGGWMGRARCFHGQDIVAYHKNWNYFVELFGLEVIDYVEPKPGIPPSARHVHELIAEVREKGVHVLLAASYFGPRKIETIAERLGLRAFIVPLGPGGEGPEDYVKLVDLWIDGLAAACGCDA